MVFDGTRGVTAIAAATDVNHSRFMAEDSTEESSIGDISGNFSPGGSKSSLDSSFKTRSHHKEESEEKSSLGNHGGAKGVFAPMKPGQFAA